MAPVHLRLVGMLHDSRVKARSKVKQVPHVLDLHHPVGGRFSRGIRHLDLEGRRARRDPSCRVRRIRW
jgi:hypothetical protein